MPLYNMHSELNEFYEKHVRLKDEIKHLRKLRDINLNRVKEGLKELDKPAFVKYLEQGSIAMSTANKAPDNDYDIDIAVIFEKDGLPATALDARKRVAEALKKKATGFTKEPEARTNAVTVHYSDGYHVDIAVYRRSEDWLGNEILEHAGPDWAKRDPKEITDWFIKDVKEQSPSEDNCWWGKPEVALGQMRRIVRWIKCFTKAREDWDLPGGLVISTLVSECYKSDAKRDDVALYETLEAIKNRLDITCKVYNPTDSYSELTEKQKFLKQVERLKKRLATTLTKLESLTKDNCTEEKAKKAWNYLFQHEFWESSESSGDSVQKNSADVISITMGTAKRKKSILTAKSIHSKCVLAKGIHLRFDAETTIPRPFEVNWRVENSGDEAEDAEQLTHSTKSDSLTQWEQTAYRGRHKMVCEILQGGRVVASTTKIVNIR